MKLKSNRRKLLLAAGISLLGVSSAHAQTTYTWDITPGNIGVGNGTITGGIGAWNTTNGNWTTDAGANNVAWVNAGVAPFNNAIFGGTAGTVTLGEAISIRNLSFTNTAGPYNITGSSLNFTAGTISTVAQTAGGNPVIASISSNITGSPNINLQPMDGDEVFTLAPAANGSMIIGAVTGDGGNGSERLSLQGGAGSSGTIASTTGPKVLVSGGSWTINGASSGRNHEISAGTLTLNANLNGTLRAVILSGTGKINYNVASAVSASAATNSSTDNGFRITGGTLDQTSGSAINTNASTQSIDLAGTLTFAGTNGASSNLHLGSGAVFLKGGNRQITVTNSATTLIIGGVIQNDNGGARSLTKAGAGTLELRGANTYSGATTVNAGTLLISAGNINTTSGVTINGATANFRYSSATALTKPITFTSGTLSGTGTIDTPVAVPNGGFLAPGNSAGSQSYNAGLTFDSGSNYNWEHTAGNAVGSAGSTYDVANITGGGTLVNSGGNLNLNFAAGTNFSDSFWDGSPTWNIVTGGSSGATLFGASNIFVNINGAPVDGGDNAISGQGSFSTAIVGNDLQLQWTASLGGSPTLSVAPGTVNFGGLLQNATLPSGSLVTISNSGATSSGSSVAITGSNPTKFAASNLSPANIPGGGSSTSTIELAAGATATNGTFTADVEYSAPSMTNVLADSTVGASVIVGNASFHGSLNTSTNFGPALVTTVNAGQVLTDVNLASNTDNATVIGGGPARVGTTATIVSYDNTLGGVETVGMAWRSRTAAEADLLNNPKALLSDVVRITGMGASETDVGTFLLTMTYDLDLPEFASLNEMAIANSGELQLAWYDPDLNEWVNAIDGNIGGSPDFVGISAPTGGLGSWGIHVDGNGGAGNGKGYVWAYLNHNSDFAVIPEPSTLVLGGLALLGFAGAGLRRRRLAKQ